MKTYLYPLILIALLAAGCDKSASISSEEKADTKAEETEVKSGGYGSIYGINHTEWGIDRLSVDGRYTIDYIGRYQGGGGGGGFGVPSKWYQGMTVEVKWQTMQDSTEGFPVGGTTEDAVKYLDKIEKTKKNHSAIVEVPDYTGQKTCGIVVHFFPCDQIKVTTSCYNYGHPNYPIKEPIRMEVPEVCPK